MGRRVLTVSELTFHQKRKPKGRTYAPSDLNDEDLLDIFHDWVTVSHSAEHPQHGQADLGLSVASATRWAPVIPSWSTFASEPMARLATWLIPSPANRSARSRTTRHPPARTARCCSCPKLVRAPFIAEESTRGSAGGHVLRLFKTHFSAYTSEITMVTSSVTEGETWAEAAELTEVEVRVEGKSADLADGPRVKVGKVSHIARPEKKHRFPGGLLKSLKDEQTLRQIVSVPDLEEDHDVFVTLIRDGRTKKFQLGTEGAPCIREVLNDSTEETLDTATLVARCTDRVSDLCDRKGDTWDAAWSRQQRKA